MDTDPWVSPRLTEDVHFHPVGRKRGYPSESSGPVRYRTVARGSGGAVLGYLWYSDAEGAAGHVPHAATGDDAFNAGTFWYGRLAAAGDRGLAPSEAVAEFEEHGVGSGGSGWIVPGSEAEAPSLLRLRLSAGVRPDGTMPLRRQGETRKRGRGGQEGTCEYR
ncbi:hypothetical protein [Streptomonospora alba]|uniref:hypothetical protein n=1 Tax=Streptomonospora alba TaxID=183763 RepID=UPI00069995AF|nr:hypothetical protein [Streptomonospora alba]